MSNAQETGIKTGANYDIWRTERITPEKFSTLSPLDQQRYLASCFATSASTHNTQPWALKLDPEHSRIGIYLNLGRLYQTPDGEIIDQRRVLPISDKNGRQA